MPSPTVDIIVPVWNSIFETRACLSSILAHSPDSRLIVVDNGSNRETQIMLEEFSEPLGDKALFLTSERNLGLVPAINLGLKRSDREYAVIVRPHVTVVKGWLAGLTAAAAPSDMGIVSPLFTGDSPMSLRQPAAKSQQTETFSVSFNTLLLKKEMALFPEGFDEDMDGGEWCLRDFIRRACTKGFHTSFTRTSLVLCGKEAVFGSDKRRREQSLASGEKYRERWGDSRHYTLYFGKNATTDLLQEAVELLICGARVGNRFTLLLHRQQATLFDKQGWSCLHTSIEIVKLSLLLPQRDLVQNVAAINLKEPETIFVKGMETVSFPGVDAAIEFSMLAHEIKKNRSGHD